MFTHTYVVYHFLVFTFAFTINIEIKISWKFCQQVSILWPTQLSKKNININYWIKHRKKINYILSTIINRNFTSTKSMNSKFISRKFLRNITSTIAKSHVSKSVFFPKDSWTMFSYLGVAYNQIDLYVYYPAIFYF